MDAVDSYIPTPERDTDKPFLMPVEDVFSISGRGTVVTGRIELGTIKVGEEIEIVGFGDTRKTTVTGVEMFRKEMDQGQAGDNCGILLRGVKKKRLKEDKFFVSQEQLNLIQNLNVKFIFFQKKKVEDILHSLVDIDHNSMLEQQTLQVLVY